MEPFRIPTTIPFDPRPERRRPASIGFDSKIKARLCFQNQATDAAKSQPTPDKNSTSALASAQNHRHRPFCRDRTPTALARHQSRAISHRRPGTLSAAIDPAPTACAISAAWLAVRQSTRQMPATAAASQRRRRLNPDSGVGPRVAFAPMAPVIQTRRRRLRGRARCFGCLLGDDRFEDVRDPLLTATRQLVYLVNQPARSDSPGRDAAPRRNRHRCATAG